MKKRFYQALCLSAAIVVAASGAAQAAVWDFSYSGGGYTASGEFTTGAAGSPYTVTGITGTADGYAITGLSTYAGANELLYYPPSGGYYADFSGISFVNANNVDYNITNYPTGSGNFINVSTLDPGGYGCCTVAVEMTVTPVPELSTWAMMLAGFAALGFAGYRRTKPTAFVRA